MNKNDTNDYIIELQHVKKKYSDSDVYAVEDFDLKIKKGEFVTFLGPSGCGKTTTLRMIAGFEMPTEGSILLNGQDISKLPPYKRPINTVFQRYALFAHLNIFDNIAFGLKLKKIPYQTTDRKGNTITKYRHYTKQEIVQKVTYALNIVDLEGFEKRKISTLSGGQQQRIAIARAIVNEPEILLLDEPLGALDLKMRKEMQIELKNMHKKLGITFIYVTHDQEEALTMSDTIVVMSDGEIQQIGTPKTIYDDPKNAFVAYFIGESNIYTGTVFANNKIRFLGKIFDSDPVDEGKFEVNEKVDVVVRPEDVMMSTTKEGIVTGKIISKTFKGIHYEYTLAVGNAEIIAQSTKDFDEGEMINIKVAPENIQIMKKPFTSNYFDGFINKNYGITFADTDFEYDISPLFPNLKKNEEGELINAKGEIIDVTNTPVTVEIGFDDLELSDNPDDSELHGQIVSMIYKGDHYQILVRTAEEEDFLLDTPDLWNENDKVSIVIKKGGMNVSLKNGEKK